MRQTERSDKIKQIINNMGATHSQTDIIKRRAVAPSHRFYFTKDVPLIESETTDSSKMSILTAKTVTWTRESHGLFDFEGQDIVKKQFKIRGSHRIYRDENNVDVEPVENLDTFDG